MSKPYLGHFWSNNRTEKTVTCLGTRDSLCFDTTSEAMAACASRTPGYPSRNGEGEEQEKARQPDAVVWRHDVAAGRPLHVAAAQTGFITIHTYLTLF